MPLSEEAQLHNIIAFHDRAQENALHHYNKMWDASRFFLWSYSLAMSGGVTVLVRVPRPLNALALGLFVIGLLISIYGTRVVSQERMLFAYEWLLRRKLDAALGWDLRPPELTQTRPIWKWRRAQVVAPHFSYGGLMTPPTALAITVQEATDIATISEGARNRGVYGVMMWLLVAARWIAAAAVSLCSLYLIWGSLIQLMRWVSSES